MVIGREPAPTLHSRDDLGRTERRPPAGRSTGGSPVSFPVCVGSGIRRDVLRERWRLAGCSGGVFAARALGRTDFSRRATLRRPPVCRRNSFRPGHVHSIPFRAHSKAYSSAHEFLECTRSFFERTRRFFERPRRFFSFTRVFSSALGPFSSALADFSSALDVFSRLLAFFRVHSIPFRALSIFFRAHS